MTIHAEHPFLDPESGRDPARRLRGRIGGAVTLWTTGDGSTRSGLTVSSVLVATGDPAHVLGLVDPDSDLALAVEHTRTAVVALLGWRHRDLADAFAGVAPAPGGVFRLGTWTETRWGPLLDGISAWAGIRFEEPARTVGWSALLDGVVEHVEIRSASLEGGSPGSGGSGDSGGSEGSEGSGASGGSGDEPLVHRRGRYLRPAEGR